MTTVSMASNDAAATASEQPEFEAGAFSRRYGKLAIELPLAVITACVVSLGLQWVITRLNIPMPSYAPLALLALSSVVLLAVAVWLISMRRWPRWATPLSWAGLSALGTLPLALMLQNTPFYLFGIDEDQFFRTQYLQRLTESIGLADGNYANMPPFYPAGWFWIGGRFANLFDMPAWAAYKPYSILTMAVAAVIAFALWSRVTRRPAAVLLSVLTCLVGVRIAAYEPYSWILAAAMLPVTVIAWRELRAVVAGRGRSWSAIALIGVFLGVCGAVYTLHFGFFGFVLVVLAVAAVFAWRRHTRNEDSEVTSRDLLRTGRTAAADLIAVGLIALPVMLLAWGPFLWRVLQNGEWPSGSAPSFLPKFGAMVPTPMFEFTAAGVLCLAGTLWILIAWRRSELARVLGMLAACCYAWYLLSFLALSMKTTLLAFRMEPVLHVVLFCAGGLAVLDLARWVSSRRFMPSGVPAGAVFAVVGLLGMVSLAQTVKPAEREANAIPVFEAAQTTYMPNGKTPRGASDPKEWGAWNDELLATVDEMTARPPQDTIMLTTYFDLLVYEPYWGFQTMTPHYANPLAQFDKRRKVIESWAKSSSSDELVRKLENSPFAPPEVFVFWQGDDGLYMQLSHGAFPHKRNVRTYDAVFSEKLFSSEHFKQRDVGPFTVVVRR